MVLLMSYVFLVMLAIMPFIAGAVAYAAWKGLPKNFSKEMYWTVFVVAEVAGALLILEAQRISLNNSWLLLAHYACGFSGLLVFAVGMGCGAAVFTYRGPIFSRSPKPKDE